MARQRGVLNTRDVPMLLNGIFRHCRFLTTKGLIFQMNFMHPEIQRNPPFTKFQLTLMTNSEVIQDHRHPWKILSKGKEGPGIQGTRRNMKRKTFVQTLQLA